MIWTEAPAMLLAFFVFFIYIYSKKLLKKKDFFIFILVVIFFMFLIGRLSYYLFLGDLAEFFNFKETGLISVGMMAGGIIGMVLFSKYRRISLLRLSNVVAPAAALWIFVFRLLGCYITGHIVGTLLPFAIGSVVRHPTALYLSFNGLLIFFVIRKFENKGLWFLFFYCFNRFWIEFFREGIKYYGLGGVQIVCLIVFILLGGRFIYHTKWA